MRKKVALMIAAIFFISLIAVDVLGEIKPCSSIKTYKEGIRITTYCYDKGNLYSDPFYNEKREYVYDTNNRVVITPKGKEVEVKSVSGKTQQFSEKGKKTYNFKDTGSEKDGYGLYSFNIDGKTYVTDGREKYYKCNKEEGTCKVNELEEVSGEELTNLKNEINKDKDNFNSQMQDVIKWSDRMKQPLPNFGFYDAWQMANGFLSLGEGIFGMEKGDLMPDLFGVSELIKTEFGQIISGNWEQSICTIQTDYDDLAESGVLMPPGTTSPSAYITARVTKVKKPKEEDPNKIIIEYYYRIELSVTPAGMTEGYLKKGEDCDDYVKFYVTAGDKKVDINRDGSADKVVLKCDGDSYSLTGSSALVIVSKDEINGKACLDFDEGDLTTEIKDSLDNGKLCNDIVESGEEIDIGDCGWWCLSGGEISIEVGGEEKEKGGKEGEYRPTPGGGGPQFV